MQINGLGSLVLTGNNFSTEQEFILQLVSLIASGISIIAGIFTLYWFFRIQTHFRHQLVTLLICSDLFKAIWYFVSAAVSLSLNPDKLPNGYCQASGFLLSFGIEASDYAILVIAIHSALCIFRPRTNLGETGLYSIRYIVYALWLALPLLAAGLGLLHGGVYIDTGAFCWLPVRPFYYRLALSWIPRYIIFIVIILLYIRIYWFVRAKFKNFHTATGNSYKQPSELGNGAASKSRRVASLLIPGLMAKNRKSQDNSNRGSRQNSRPTNTPQRSVIDPGPAWENYAFGSSTLPLPGPDGMDSMLAPSQRGAESVNKASVSTQRTSVPEPGNIEVRRSLVEFLKEDPIEHGYPSPAHINPTLVTEEVNSETRARQTAIKRQLRFMFIYPLFYIISWIPPLVQHFTLYSDSFAASPSFPLACVSTCFVAIQCAMDSIIFSYRETPWRYVEREVSMPDIDSSQSGDNRNSKWLPSWRKEATEEPLPAQTTDETTVSTPPQTQQHSRNSSRTYTPRNSLINRMSHTLRGSHDSTAGGSRLSSSAGGSFFSKTPGRSKGDMLAEARAARQRRELESSTAREGLEERQRARKQSILRRGGADRSWWEVEGRRRKDSVLLGLDADSLLSRTRSRGNTTGETDVASPNSAVASPSSLAASLFSPRRFRNSSVSNTPMELSPRMRLPISPEELSPTDVGGLLSPQQSPSPTRLGTSLPTSPRDREQSMPTVDEEDDAPLAGNTVSRPHQEGQQENK